MKIGYYYHLEASIYEGVLYMPALLGVFIDDLSKRVERLILLVHIAPYDSKLHDYPLSNERIQWINLGSKHDFAHRLLLGKKSLANLPDGAFDIDILLVRAPTPLAPALYSTFEKRCPVAFMIVGDYSEQPAKLLSPSWFLNCIYERIVNHWVLPHCIALVNSPILQKKYETICRETQRIKTTTLRKSDFFYRKDTCKGGLIHLLYVGRFDWQKGLQELFETVAKLKNHRSLLLHMVGWDTDIHKQNLLRMEKTILELDINNNIVIEGYKKVGEEINRMYEMADIFVLPSYAEGFPRCIWEAMAHGTPVVATTVGGIPEVLTNDETALLIPPHNTMALADAVERIIDDEILRKTIIEGGYTLVSDVTLEVQNEIIINILKDKLVNNKI